MLPLILVLGIGIQNVPEGFSVALALKATGFSIFKSINLDKEKIRSSLTHQGWPSVWLSGAYSWSSRSCPGQI